MWDGQEPCGDGERADFFLNRETTKFSVDETVKKDLDWHTESSTDLAHEIGEKERKDAH